MILDELSTERSALHALELLDCDERGRFERDARIDPDLAACTAEFRDIGASIAVARCSRLEPPPLKVLTGALERIGATEASAPRQISSLRTWPGALAVGAAAMLFIGGGATVWKLGRVEEQNPDVAALIAQAGGQDQVIILRNGEPVATLDASEQSIMEMLDKLNRMQRLRPAPDLIQDIARLKRELKSLRKVDAERFSASPRVARTVYIEMVEPGTEGGGGELSERVTDYIATAIELEVGESGGSAPIEKPPAAEAEEPIIFEPEDSGALPDLNDLGEDRPFFYRGFPAGADRFERIDEGRVWDAENQRIWIQTDEPGLFQAVVPPVGFDPDFIDDYAGIIPLGGSLPAPASTIPPAAVEEFYDPGEAVEVIGPVRSVPAPSPPVAVTIYEETSGRGSVVIGNLPPAGDGHSYQLWMRNAADDRVVSVGMLPPLGDGSERFEFDLLGPGITPAGFFLTLEPKGGVETPSETVILQGP